MRKIEAIQRSIIMLNAMLFGAWPFLLKAAVTSALGSLEELKAVAMQQNL